MKIRILFIILVLITALSAFGSDDLIFKTMKEEMERSLEKLRLENLQAPFFISYTVTDGDYLVIRASLGSLLSSVQQPNNFLNTRVMAGSYERNNENFFNMRGSGGTSQQPLGTDPSYFGLRRALWLSSDSAYKQAAELYESKISAIGQQNLPEEIASLPDYTKREKTTLVLPSGRFEPDREKWENTAREVSSIFLDYPEIYSSGVSVYLYSADIFFYDAEGTMTRVPYNFAAVYADASTQADDGEPIFDCLTYFGTDPGDLPDMESLKKDVKLLADRTLLLKNAGVFDDSYMGPVLFEGNAVGEVIAQGLFPANSGLNAMRDLIYSDSSIASYVSSMIGQNFEDMLEKRLMAKAFSIKAVPALKEYNGKKLIGSFKIDSEGVIPAEELVLVEKGIVKTLLNGRTPTAKISQSNGHNRLAMSMSRTESQIGPGVIIMEAEEKGQSMDDLKNMLMETAKDEGLEFGILVRKILPPTANINKEADPLAMMYSMSRGSSGMSRPSIKPLYVYKVYVEDGREELVRSADLQSLSSRAFRDIIGWSDNMTAYNTVIVDTASSMGFGNYMLFFGGSVWPVSGLMSSFIVPDALLFESLELKKEKRAVTEKPPAIENPLKK